MCIRDSFKSDGVVLRQHKERHGMVQLPAQWTLSGNVVTVAFHPSHAKSGLVPKEISFGVLPNGDMRGINEAKDALLTKQERQKESGYQSENAPSN